MSGSGSEILILIWKQKWKSMPSSPKSQEVLWPLAGSFLMESHGELVGYSNGFPCMANVNCFGTSYTILQPSRGGFIHIYHPSILGEPVFHASTICHGFGFDSLANEYKLVSVFRTSHKQLNILVFTLGTKSWRDITATSAHVAHDGQTISWIRASTSSDRSAVFCSSGSECLVWKIITTIVGVEGANEMEMLLSFNIHDEKFQFIQLPSKGATDEQQQHLSVTYPRLLEFKGFPCIAYLEKNNYVME
ncbi:hypothetical protein C5167_036109 [Papaver somniferum]|nr:hypothetical protein C5167_036109 [Papaver somniferum]